MTTVRCSHVTLKVSEFSHVSACWTGSPSMFKLGLLGFKDLRSQLLLNVRTSQLYSRVHTTVTLKDITHLYECETALTDMTRSSELRTTPETAGSSA
ncbi:hypothetical protein CHARACLAT_021432 [Characodon lateralis]|uniref:Uncharacterized protein n=1 Tax=Characodon lateralis TaxID=208331 RepID=A0ABU7E3V8_9TELE|nr:hypothetical protein [Characodon lateralis]